MKQEVTLLAEITDGKESVIGLTSEEIGGS